MTAKTSIRFIAAGSAHFVHQNFVEYANQSVLHCQWANCSSGTSSPKVKKHLIALRALAFKGQRIMFVCWCDRVSYDETAYLTSSNAETHRSLINSDSNFSKPPESAVNNFTQND